VADVVPADLGSANAPIGALRRGYGSDPETVAAKASAFVRGMDRAGVATAVKHFPGLGRGAGQHRLRAPGGRRQDHSRRAPTWRPSPRSSRPAWTW
jgi:beta-glucosidase-like glycosyl hydrolase